ncbi:hypothetical protein [Nocardia grenadensis]|uniref:hypothetical protein n=1 Tax=Nocardia grenadensis TaxID=931537 RepID=UPI003D71C76A
MSEKPDLYKAAYLLSEYASWQHWATRKGKDIPVGDLGTVQVVSVLEDSRSRDYYDEYGQGSTAPAGIVFRVEYPDGSVRFFEKNGTYDSYGAEDYSGGSFFEVEKVSKEIFVYERV